MYIIKVSMGTESRRVAVDKYVAGFLSSSHANPSVEDIESYQNYLFLIQNYAFCYFATADQEYVRR